MADSSFDIVSKVDHQEVDNALNQTAKEISQRFDFKNVGASIAWSGEKIEMQANSEERVKAVLDVFQTKLVKRGISLKSLKAGDPALSGQGVPPRRRRSSRASRRRTRRRSRRSSATRARSRSRPRSRATSCGCRSKSRDDLQAVQALLKGKDLDFAVQFVNYR